MQYIPRVGVIINSYAGAGKATQAGKILLDTLPRMGSKVFDYTASSTEQTIKKIKQAITKNMIDLLVAVGGDGTIHLAANALRGSNVPLGIVAVGTGNDIAGALGLPVQNIRKSVSVLLAYLAGVGQVQKIDTVSVTDGNQHWVSDYLAVLSCGIDAAINAYANTLSFPKGPTKYLRSALHVIPRFKPYGIRIKTTNEEIELAASLVSIASLGCIGGGIKIAPTANYQDGILDVVIAKAARKPDILGIFPKIYRGSHLSHPAFSTFRASEVTIYPSEVGAVAPLAMADGEPIGNLPLSCKVNKQSLPIIMPDSDTSITHLENFIKVEG